ncbi:MAG TPA: hypothetical protein VIR63_05850 [Pontiella sp.]
METLVSTFLAVSVLASVFGLLQQANRMMRYATEKRAVHVAVLKQYYEDKAIGCPGLVNDARKFWKVSGNDNHRRRGKIPFSSIMTVEDDGIKTLDGGIVTRARKMWTASSRLYYSLTYTATWDSPTMGRTSSYKFTVNMYSDL